MDTTRNPLDLSYEELVEACRVTAASGTQFWYKDYRDELERKGQDRSTKAMFRLTVAIGIFTVIQTAVGIVAIVIALKHW